jgi:hypothetical protein
MMPSCAGSDQVVQVAVAHAKVMCEIAHGALAGLDLQA